MDDHDIHTDEDIERLAGELHERIRELNRVIQEPPGLSQPTAVYTVLGNLAQTAFRLVQTTEHLDAFLTAELDAGRLGHDRGTDPVPTVMKAHNALARAAEQTMELGETFRRAQGALAAIHANQTTVGPSSDRDEVAAASLTNLTDHSAAPDGAAGEDFPRPIDDVLPDAPHVEQASSEPRSKPQVPPPRRER
ncbi:hypothetical protein [Actinomadura rubrisoli]|uniref:Uncharacterized protein n=1 Tax=Actinomadura rubrisoli TaxID=2530368 RepID=A0A4R5AI26_9ACTN|nr:hypothetical protein [Actinomadura rubrisoli]TDD71120.1 hypothetical protein E1298_36180 [Actinomadura rubrisoli]